MDQDLEDKQKVIDILADKKITIEPTGYIAVPLEPKAYEVRAVEWAQAETTAEKLRILAGLVEEDPDRDDFAGNHSLDYVIQDWNQID
jgi:hypothetical protein